MDRWLVCFPAALPAERREAVLRAAGARLAPHADPVPLGAEVVVAVEADAAAVAVLRAAPEVAGLYPDSEQTLY